MKKQGKAAELVSRLGSIPIKIWILAGVAIFFVYAVLSEDEVSSLNDEPAAEIIGPKTYARRAVQRAEFRAEVRQAQAQIVMENGDLVAYWAKYLERTACDDVQTKGFSLEPICIQKEAYQQELLKRGICKKGQSAVSCDYEKYASADR
jgi:hypothetical protein